MLENISRCIRIILHAISSVCSNVIELFVLYFYSRYVANVSKISNNKNNLPMDKIYAFIDLSDYY